MILQAKVTWTNNKTANFDALHSSLHKVFQTLLTLTLFGPSGAIIARAIPLKYSFVHDGPTISRFHDFS